MASKLPSMESLLDMVDVVSRRPAHLGYSFSCIRLLRCGRRRGHGHWGGLGTLSNAIFVQADFVASLRVPGSVPLRELGFRSTTKHSERRRLGNTRWSAASMMELGSVRMCSFWCRAGATFLGRETSGRSSGIPATTELLASMCGRRCERSRRFLSIRCCVTKSISGQGAAPTAAVPVVGAGVSLGLALVRPSWNFQQEIRALHS